jgi:SAM-dependent methyltransferase
MLDLIRNLPAGARVLDLGAGPGSFPSERPDLLVVRLDVQRPQRLGMGTYVLADAAHMPFASASFDLIVSNHSLEHFTELNARGHVNPFRSAAEVSGLVERLTGLPLRSTTVLFSALSFLNAHNFPAPPPRRIALFAFGNERFLAVSIWMLRGLDRRLGTRLGRYGWAFRFGNVSGAEPTDAWVNVCVRCGAGHSEAYLRKNAPLRKVAGLFPVYRCPACGGFNLLSAGVTKPDL